MSNTCQMLSLKTGLECGKPADFKINNSTTYFCKNCYRSYKKVGIELNLLIEKTTMLLGEDE
jgi:hypothetical protein